MPPFGDIPGQPPGHIPGVHIPGTLTPIGAVVAQQQQAQAEAEQKKEKRRRANLLLTLD